MNLSPEQETAIHAHEYNLMVVAGAGSGKTYVLVNRYLSLLHRHRDWPLNSLVAITFTRKAAQEMRDRVRLELELRYNAAQNHDDRDTWAARIAAMESARIDTIHALCTSILRANAAEAGIDPKFEVLDEVEALRLLEDVIDDVLRVIVSERDQAVKLFTEYNASAVRDALIRLIGADLGDLSRDLPADWLAEWERMRGRIIDRFAEHHILHSVHRWDLGGFRPGSDKLIDVWLNCQEIISAFLARIEVEDRLMCLRELYEAINLRVGSPKFYGSADAMNEVKAPLKNLRELLKGVFQEIGEPPGELDHRAASLLPLWDRLIRRAQVAYRLAKDRDRLLDFDDLERLTRDVLYRRPHVRSRYQRNEFQHILVDEFQDTNAAQWDIVRALADPAHPGSLFVVGDAKQSIYQFRGADVSVFEQVRGGIISAGGRDVPLVRSFRTHHQLVECFNHLFAAILAKDPLSPVSEFEIELGQPMQAFRAQSPADCASLELLLIDKTVIEGDDRAERARRWEAYEIASRLRHIVEVEGRQVYDKAAGQHRPISYGDIALLFQSMSNINTYEDVFKAANLPFVTVAGRGYYSRQEVWDLLNLLTALHNPADDLRLAAALRSPLFSLSDDALLALRIQRGGDGNRLPLWDALGVPVGIPGDELGLVESAHDILHHLHGLTGRVTISELLREILLRTGYLATLTSLPDGARRRGNVEKLLEKAETSGQVTLGAFSQYLRDLSAREVREGEALVDVGDAMTLMTVHASKGLEFPLVVLVDSSWERGWKGSPAVMHTPHYGLTCKVYDPEQDRIVGCFTHKQAEKMQSLRDDAERKRLLYVAATRAQDYLLISGQINHSDKSGWKADGWLGLIWNALPLHDFEPSSGEHTLDFPAWGQLSVLVPSHPSEDESFTSVPIDTPMWDHPAVREGQPLPGEVESPLLLDRIRVAPSDFTRHLTATQIANLGGVDFDAAYRDKFRRSVLHGAPSPVEDVRQYPSVSKRTIGEIVHKVLSFPNQSADLDKIIESYAWEQGIVDANLRAQAVREAHTLLQRTRSSDVHQWMQQAEANKQPVFRELPFILKNDGRVIHGVIDVLFKWGETWVIVDYKTSSVLGYRDDGQLQYIREHAKRYHLQMGAYALAAREQLGGITPEVYIHYIRYAETIQVYAGEWELALGKIEQTIGQVLNESDWV